MDFPRPSGAKTQDPFLGHQIGHCRLEQKLGEGGMGVVYLARHLTLNKTVAVKILRENLPAEMRARRRFLKEARAAARLEHPNIVQIYDAGVEGRLAYIVMQYVKGESLAKRLRMKTRLPLNEALYVFRSALLALCHAHANGIVHRDVKPDNILLGDDGSVRLADFGLAQVADGDPNLTVTGAFMGSPAYMSPEQALGKPLDERTDLYSLGATLYQMVTGRPPFCATSVMSTVYKIVREPLKPPSAINHSIPAPLSKYICLLMQKDLDKRISSANRAHWILQRLQWSNKKKLKRRPATLLALTTILVVVAVLLLAFNLSQKTRLDGRLPSAEAEGRPDDGQPSAER